MNAITGSPPDASPANPWDADIGVSPDDAARRIAKRFPELAPIRIEPFGEGWDNVAYRVNDAFVFRFPRRQVAVPLLETEACVLPHLAPLLPVRVPDMRFRGVADELSPIPFVGYTLLPGTTGCRLAWTDDQRTDIAVPLATALRALHGIPTDSDWAQTVPLDTIRRADIPYRADALRRRLEQLTPHLAASHLDALHAAVDRLGRTPLFDGEPRLLHGDLYARHLLVDKDRRLSGLIDWGDVHRGDPALDLSIAFSFLPATGDARKAFREAYGPVDDATWDRARFRAVHYGTILAHYGIDTDDGSIRDAGFYALTMALWGE